MPPLEGHNLHLINNKSMTFNAVAMNASRLMVVKIPKSRVTRSLGWIYVIDTLGNNRTSRIQVQRAQLILRLR